LSLLSLRYIHTPVSPSRFAEKLVGATCEITFTLKHYAIRAQTKADGKVIEAYDTFSAQVEAVAILKNPLSSRVVPRGAD
jgi:hypothetical protein